MFTRHLQSLPNLDQLLSEVDNALRVLSTTPHAQRPNPANHLPTAAQGELNAQETKQVIGMMRVNHVGEICAQALYRGQALTCAEPDQKAVFHQAAVEETDHLAWSLERLNALGGRPSLLNPLWYSGALALGCVAGQLGNAINMGFMAETERQVEQHLDSHLQQLPPQDQASRVIIEQMKQDEIEHGNTAWAHGAKELPMPVRWAMRGMAKIMTTLAYRI